MKNQEITGLKIILFIAALGEFHCAIAADQGGYYAIPSVGVAKVYDNNIFFSPESEEDDLITRVTPRFETGYGSAIFSWQGSYSFDAEYYDKNKDLNSNQMRRFGTLSFEYFPNQRVEMTLQGDYTRTQTPGELNLSAGLQPGRLSAERTSVRPAVSANINPVLTGTLQQSFTRDNLSGGIGGDTYETRTALEHTVSNQNTFTYGYLYRRYVFEDFPRQYSHTPTIGVQHNFSQRTSLNLVGGPRITEDATRPYVELSVLYQYGSGQLNLGFARDETTFIGEAGRRESKSFNFSVTHQISTNLDVSISPRYGSVSRNNSDVEVYGVGMLATLEVNDVLTVNVSFDYNHQNEKISLVPENDRALERNVFLLGAIITYPILGRTGR